MAVAANTRRPALILPPPYGLVTLRESGDAFAHAKYMRDKIVPAMAKLRIIGDEIEVHTPHEIWPLPTYREMLFVK